jgi:Cd2+/Zn2+-exporting ATPase
MKTKSQETTFAVDDLCCATEEQKIRKRLESEPGVQGLEFNFVSHRLKVQHTCDDQVILNHLKEIGLPGINERAGRTTRNKLHQRLLLSTGLSAMLFVGGLAAGFAAAPKGIVIGFFIGSMVAGGWHIGIKAFKSVRMFSLDMNFLMTMASIGAIALGHYAEGAAVVFLFAVSLVLESVSMDRTRRAIRSLLSLSPLSATILRDEAETTVAVEEIAVGDIVIVRPGERIGVDGKVVKGRSTVNEAPITGESMPVPKGEGDPVYAGSFNQRGSLNVQTSKRATDSTIARMIHLVEEAQSKKAPSQSFVDQFARYYTPAVFGLAIVLALVPPVLFHGLFAIWLYRALVLLVIACPCALVISTPVTLVSALTTAARNGVLVKGGKYLELLSHVRAVAFDKTGTLTEGRPVVTDVVSLNALSPTELIRIAAAAEIHSEHRLADALLRKAEEEGISFSDVTTEDFASITGKGIRTKVNGKTYVIGNHQLMEELGVCGPAVEKVLFDLEQQGKTAVIVSDDQQVLGIIAIADRIRRESRSTVGALHKLGVRRVVLLTGDNAGTASSVAGLLGVDELKSELLPEDKLTGVQKLRSQWGPVAMVGDGINDAPALAAADVGIAMGAAGSDTALETADVVLMADNIAKVPFSISLGRKALRVIKQNISLALAIKAAFILLAVFGLTSLWLAILADDGATLVVILNSLRLLKGDHVSWPRPGRISLTFRPRLGKLMARQKF